MDAGAAGRQSARAALPTLTRLTEACPRIVSLLGAWADPRSCAAFASGLAASALVGLLTALFMSPAPLAGWAVLSLEEVSFDDPPTAPAVRAAPPGASSASPRSRVPDFAEVLGVQLGAAAGASGPPETAHAMAVAAMASDARSSPGAGSEAKPELFVEPVAAASGALGQITTPVAAALRASPDGLAAAQPGGEGAVARSAGVAPAPRGGQPAAVAPPQVRPEQAKPRAEARQQAQRRPAAAASPPARAAAAAAKPPRVVIVEGPLPAATGVPPTPLLPPPTPLAPWERSALGMF